MKKGLLALSLVAMLFTACKKDKNEEPANVTPTVANIAGTYRYVQTEQNYHDGLRINGTGLYLFPE
jgi:hypothetical protein